MPEMHLKQPRFTYSACGPFTKSKERIQEFKETGDASYIYKNELDKACFQHDMAYGDFKNLERGAASDNVLRVKALNIAKNPKYGGYQREIASMVHKFFDKKSKGSGFNIEIKHNEQLAKQRGIAFMVYKFFDEKSKGSGFNIEVKHNEQLAKELHKPITRNFEKRTVYSRFKDNIWEADLADMQLISKFNKEFRFLLCVIDIFSKYAWVVPLKDKRGFSTTVAFQKFLDKSARKPNKI